jgi:hypothetical protein
MKPKRGRGGAAASSAAAPVAEEPAEVPASHSKASASSKKGAIAAAEAPVLEKPIKKEFKGKREVELASPDADLGGRAKRQRLRDGEGSAEDTTSLPASALVEDKGPLEGVKAKEDFKVYTANTLFSLERRLKDILSEIEAVEVPEFTDEELYGTSAPKKSAKKGKVEERGMRRLAEDFESVPYDAVPNYDKLVPRVVTLDSMNQQLSEHKYKSMAEFVDDFYQLLNNARSITQPDSVVSACAFTLFAVDMFSGCFDIHVIPVRTMFTPHASLSSIFSLQTWSDARRLSEIFEESRVRNTTASSASEPRAPGKEVAATKLSGAAAGGAAAEGDYLLGKGGRAKWTCACCKNPVRAAQTCCVHVISAKLYAAGESLT